MSASVDLPDTGTGKVFVLKEKRRDCDDTNRALFGGTCLSSKRPEKLECTKFLGIRSSPLTKYFLLTCQIFYARLLSTNWRMASE